jgi:hypothetical protein
MDFDIYVEKLKRTGKIHISSKHSDWKSTAESVIDHFGVNNLKVDWRFNGVGMEFG